MRVEIYIWPGTVNNVPPMRRHINNSRQCARSLRYFGVVIKEFPNPDFTRLLDAGRVAGAKISGLYSNIP
jgi:hypothetical protein